MNFGWIVLARIDGCIKRVDVITINDEEELSNFLENILLLLLKFKPWVLSM
jgi:hypothetical protein